MFFLQKNERPPRTDFLQDVVKQLVKARHYRGLTQEKVNGRLGIADRLVNKWECGTKSPTAFLIYCWAEIVKCKIMIIPEEKRKEVEQILEDFYGRQA